MTVTLSADTVARLVAIAGRAGDEIMKIYATDFDVDTKADASPVTLADRLADDLIVAALTDEIDVDFPIVSEESFQADVTRVDADAPFWLVDPLDGTKQFVNKRDEFTVNIGLIENGRPVFGVVHAPALGMTYWGGADGAFRQTGDAAPERLSVRSQPPSGIAAVVSRSHKTPETDDYLSHFTVADEVSSGSSIKFCRVAEGAADLYPRFGHTMEWDTAAAHAVLLAAGGIIFKTDGTELGYAKTGFHNPFFVACSADLKDDVLRALS